MVCLSGFEQRLQCGLVAPVELALVLHGTIMLQTEPFERFELLFGGAWHDARWIDVLDAKQPPSILCTCLQPAANGSDQRSEMQRAGRRWCEPSDVGFLLFCHVIGGACFHDRWAPF